MKIHPCSTAHFMPCTKKTWTAIKAFCLVPDRIFFAIKIKHDNLPFRNA